MEEGHISTSHDSTQAGLNRDQLYTNFLYPEDTHKHNCTFNRLDWTRCTADPLLSIKLGVGVVVTVGVEIGVVVVIVVVTGGEGGRDRGRDIGRVRDRGRVRDGGWTRDR